MGKWKIEFTDAQMQMMKRMYEEEGKSCHYLAGVFGISHDAIVRRLHAMGAKVRRTGPAPSTTPDIWHGIRNARAKGLCWAAVETMFRWHPTYLRKMIRRLEEMGFYNEEKVLYFASGSDRLHVAPDERKRDTTLHRLVQGCLQRGLLLEHEGRKDGHKWYRTTPAGEIRLLELQIEWREERDKDVTEHRERLEQLKKEAA